MRVKCKSCHEYVDSANIDLARSIAKCDHCGEIFNCADQLKVVASSGSSFPSRPEISLPKNFKVEYVNGGLRITRRWVGGAVFGLLVFCVFWDGFMIVWYTVAIMQKQWGMAAFGTIHALIGVGITYGVICEFVNRTEILITQGKIQIQHVPLPTFKAKEFDIGQIAQLYTKQEISQGRNSTSIRYDVRMKTRDGKDQKLITNLSEQEHGLYIEQQIERYLGISDTPVQGEAERF